MTLPFQQATNAERPSANHLEQKKWLCHLIAYTISCKYKIILIAVILYDELMTLPSPLVKRLYLRAGLGESHCYRT